MLGLQRQVPRQAVSSEQVESLAMLTYLTFAVSLATLLAVRKLNRRTRLALIVAAPVAEEQGRG